MQCTMRVDIFIMVHCMHPTIFYGLLCEIVGCM